MGDICQVDGCRARRKINYKLYGCSVKVFGACAKGHDFIWESSDVVTSKAGGRLYVDNLNFASSLATTSVKLWYLLDFMGYILLE